MRILHLSDTPLAGSPIRISSLLAKYGGVESRHIVWRDKLGFRDYGCDIAGNKAELATLRYMIYEWADILHYHCRWKRQEVFKALGTPPPNKPSVIQMHSPRYEGEDFSEEVQSGIPIAVIAQYHVRQWPEHKYLVPNVVDIYHKDYTPDFEGREIAFKTTGLPVVSYAPSNTTAKGWADKSYDTVAPVLKRMRNRGEIHYQLLQQMPFEKVIAEKKYSDLGTDEVSTGSYHLSSLEYLSLGAACIANIDALTEKAIKDVTGASELPWIRATKDSFETTLRMILHDKLWTKLGEDSRKWMENYWNPPHLCSHYLRMYEDLA